MKREQVLQLSNFFKVNSDELLTLWLGEKVYKVVEEDELGLNALKVAEQQLKYKSAKK